MRSAQPWGHAQERKNGVRFTYDRLNFRPPVDVRAARLQSVESSEKGTEVIKAE